MTLTEFWKNLRQNQRVLAAAGAGFFALFLVLFALSLFDAQQILGINRWVKPMKFAVSIGIYFWTLAVYLYFLPGFERSKKTIAYGAAALMTGEIILILMQAARGTTSHFNHSTAFDDIVFNAMGMMIAVNTILLIYLTVLYFRARFELPRAIVWGMRFGLLMFLLASFQGAYMSAQIGHAVGVNDGGAGLPFVNWSTEGGDLRAAHFMGMHALQAIPVFSLMIVRLQKRFAAIRPAAFTAMFALLYLASFALILIQALAGKPLFGKVI